MKKCLDEGTLQSFLDGELAPAMMKDAAAHLAICVRCSDAAREAERELTMFTSAFALDTSLNIPTEKLRERLDAVISKLETPLEVTRQKETTPGLRQWFTTLAASLMLTPQRATAFAGLVAVVVFGIVFVVIQSRVSQTGDNDSDKSGKILVRATPSPAETQKPIEPNLPKASNVETAESGKVKADDARIVSAAYKRPRKVKTAPTSNALANNVRAVAPTESYALLPGEENYLKSITSLARTIEVSGDAALRPSLRTEYERNLAVINEAIDETRQVARRNPKDQDATQFLYSAYQNKIDLMNAIADQAQMAAIGR